MRQETREQVFEALRRMIYETTHMSPLEDDGSHKCRISKDALAGARAALALLREDGDGWKPDYQAPKAPGDLRNLLPTPPQPEQKT
jgi:hypothetical protein